MLRFKDVFRKDLKTFNTDTTSWEDAASNSLHWRAMLYQGIKEAKEKWLKEESKESEEASIAGLKH